MNWNEYHYSKESENGAVQKIVVILRMCPGFIPVFKKTNDKQD